MILAEISAAVIEQATESATEDSAVGIPAFGNLLFTLDDLFVEDGSALVGGRSGGRYRAPLGTRSLIFANVDAEGTHYPGANAGFYHAAIGVGAGVAHRLNERHVVSANFNGYGSWVPELDYLRSLGVTANWDYQISERGQITSVFNFADLSFDEVIEYRDVRQYLFGSGYTHTFNDRLRIGGHVFGGMEDEQDDRRPDVGRDIVGVRALMTYGFSKKLTAYSSFAAQFSKYNGPDGLFLRTRDDDQFRVTGGLEYRFAPLWTLRPEINYVRNDSNIPTSKFERVVATISVRRNFE